MRHPSLQSSRERAIRKRLDRLRDSLDAELNRHFARTKKLADEVMELEDELPRPGAYRG